MVESVALLSALDFGKLWGRQLDDEGIAKSVCGGIERASGRRKVGGLGRADHVGVAAGIHGDSPARILSAASKIGRGDERGAAWVEHRHESVGTTAPGVVDGAGRD